MMEDNKSIDHKKIQPIIEVYACLQSEGKLTGIPHVLIRTTGCVMRCQFSETDFCDSWYTSWHPEKGKWNIERIITFIKKHPHIKHTMITGGSPTMHPDLLIELCRVAKSFGHHITIETEGSVFVQTLADLISLSPKFSNSIPQIGTTTPNGREITQKDVDLHEKSRMHFSAMSRMISNHRDYQLKPVISSLDDIQSLKRLQEILLVPNDMCWLMPAGGTAQELSKHRVWLMEYCWQNGYNYTDRIHVVAYNDKRGV